MIKRDRGAPHSTYFSDLQAELRDRGPGKPVLLLDMDALDANIEVVKRRVAPGLAVRVVAKSLASIPLLRRILDRLGTRRIMVFDDTLGAIARALPDADILIGKPMPVRAAARFYEEGQRADREDSGSVGTASPSGEHSGGRARVRWLVDGADRLAQYASLGRRLGITIRVCVEVDVGLHRGGVSDVSELLALMKAIAEDPAHLAFAGLMGYEAHVASAPPLISSLQSAFDASVARLVAAKQAVIEQYPRLCEGDVVWNAGGSKTYSLYSSEGPASEVALGSCLVKPTDFDVPTLVEHVPAAFIAAPVLKRLAGVRVPFLEGASRAWAALDPNRAVTYFLYGGGWLAKPVSPEGLSDNPLYGFSTNQAMLNGSERTGLHPDDWVFFRPTQSERVLQEFGALQAVEKRKLTGLLEALPFS